jgi:hypothetical protein
MNRALVRWLLRTYPPAWRERYGEEFADLLHASPGGMRTISDVLLSAFCERWSRPPHEGLAMSEYPGSILALSKQPSAFVPMAMSIAALGLVLVALARFGIPPPHTDEGAVAHTWQLLMVCQGIGIAWFAVKWLPQTPRLVLGVLMVQVVLAVAAMAPVYVLGL